MQAKVYDLEGYFSVEKAKEDLPFYGDRAKKIEENASSASDFWILYDRPKFKENENNAISGRYSVPHGRLLVESE